MEQIAVVVIARELGLQRSLVFQRGRRSSQLCLKVLCLRTGVNRCRAVQVTHVIVEIDLLAVVVDERFLLNVGLIAQVGVRVGALLVGHVGFCGGWGEIKEIGGGIVREDGFLLGCIDSCRSTMEVDGGGGLRRQWDFDGAGGV